MVIEPHFVPSFKPAKTFVEAVKTSEKLMAEVALEKSDRKVVA